MSILANHKPASKSRPKWPRFIALETPFNAEGRNGVLRITEVRGKRQPKPFEERYAVSRVPSDYGQGFLVEKLGEDAEESKYHVILNAEQHSCECRGFLGYGHCKHVDGLAALDKAGKLTPAAAPAKPHDRLCPWCKDRPEKCGCNNPAQDGDYAGYPDEATMTEQDMDAMAQHYGQE
jgi:hypothetical protein